MYNFSPLLWLGMVAIIASYAYFLHKLLRHLGWLDKLPKLGWWGNAPKIGWQDKAGLTLTQYAERLRGCAEEIEQPHADVFWDMAEHLERIREEVMADARDLAQARKFIYHHARIIVELVEKYVALHTKARAEHTDRLQDMATQVHSYRALFGRVEKALIDNDFADMEATMAALDQQIERLAF